MLAWAQRQPQLLWNSRVAVGLLLLCAMICVLHGQQRRDDAAFSPSAGRRDPSHALLPDNLPPPPLVYIYPIPDSLYAADLDDAFTTYDVTVDWRECYSTEWVIPAAWEHAGLVTSDPLQASFFLVPHASSAQFHACLGSALFPDKNDCYAHVAGALSRVIDHVMQLPYYAASGGHDHAFIFAHDGALASFSFPPGSRASNADRLRGALLLLNQGNALATDHEPHRTIVTMPFAVVPEPGPPEEEAAPQFPSTVGYFSGGLHGRRRRDIFEALQNETGFVFLTSRDPSYAQSLHSARFCLHLAGYGQPLYQGRFPHLKHGAVWSGRIAHILGAGCVPVIVIDNLDLPLGGVANWASFSLRVSEDTASVRGELASQLRGISEPEWRQMRHNLRALRGVFTYAPPDLTWRPTPRLGAAPRPHAPFRPDAALATYLEILIRLRFGVGSLEAAIERAAGRGPAADLFRCLFVTPRACTE